MKITEQKDMWLSTTLKLLTGNRESEMLLFAAYIDDGLCYEFFCDGVDPKTFDLVHDAFKSDSAFRNAVLDSDIIPRSVQHFISVTFDDYNNWYHLADGTETILSTPDLYNLLPIKDRSLARCLFALWNEGMLDEDSWNSYMGRDI